MNFHRANTYHHHPTHNYIKISTAAQQQQQHEQQATPSPPPPAEHKPMEKTITTTARAITARSAIDLFASRCIRWNIFALSNDKSK